MAGKIIAMSKVKQLLQLHKSGTSNRQIAKMLKISRDKLQKTDDINPCRKRMISTHPKR